ncbi:MAG: hypothetical protein U0930_17295 [Pirellulales bacterium]
MKKNRKTLACLIAVLLIGGTTSGCATWKKSSSEKSWNPKTWFKKEYQEPVSMATIWRADRMAEPGQREMRGFGARVYFYNEKSQAIPVDGDVVVHGYVTTPSSRKTGNEQSDKKFTYTSEQLASQYSPSDMGASYSIWVPWDEDGFREEVTLIATFKSKKGGVVQASPTKIYLPGKSPLPDEQMPQVTQQVSYKKSKIPTYDIGPEPEKLPSTRVTTIELPQKSRLNQPYVQTPVQNSYINSAGDGTAVEVGGRGNNSALNQVAPRLENLPPPPQGATQANTQLVGFQQPAVGQVNYNQVNANQAMGVQNLTQVGQTTLSPSSTGQQGWGQPGWGQSRFSQAQSARTNSQPSGFSQPTQPNNPGNW